MSETPQIRSRVNVGVSVKGVVTFDATVEVTATFPTPTVDSEYIATMNEIARDTLKEQFDKLRETYGQGENYQPITPHAGALEASLADKDGVLGGFLMRMSADLSRRKRAAPAPIPWLGLR